MRIPFLKASLPRIEAWQDHLQTAYDQSWFSNFGTLERRFAAQCATTFARSGYEVVTVTNATSGLTAALIGLGVKGRVLIPSFTFAGTLHAVKAAGCTPYLADVDPMTSELSLGELDKALERGGIHAVMPVRAFGFVRDQSALVARCKDHGIPVIFDSAAAFGAPGLHGAVGSAGGEIEVFSLHATKTVAVGEGGLVFAPSEIAERIRQATNFGFQPDRRFGDGGNMKLDEVRAAIGLAALEQAPGIIARRAELAAEYGALFAKQNKVAAAPTDPGPTPWQSYPVCFANTELRSAAIGELAKDGIETRAYYAPSLSQAYLGARLEGQGETPVSDDLADRMLCLPLYHQMSQNESDYVLRALQKMLEVLA